MTDEDDGDEGVDFDMSGMSSFKPPFLPGVSGIGDTPSPGDLLPVWWFSVQEQSLDSANTIFAH